MAQGGREMTVDELATHIAELVYDDITIHNDDHLSIVSTETIKHIAKLIRLVIDERMLLQLKVDHDYLNSQRKKMRKDILEEASDLAGRYTEHCANPECHDYLKEKIRSLL